MNCIIPFTKDIKFNTTISEVVSISLEHEFTANPEEILGNFIISGEYKTHEVSVNKEHFEHVLPFSVNLTSKIDPDSVDFAIEDFTYELVSKDTLKVNIEYSVTATEVKPDVFEKVEEPRDTLEEILDNIDEEVEERNTDTLEEQPEIKEELKKEESSILESATEEEETFVTYHIHIMQESDTIESICTKYNTSTSTLGEYNDLSTVAIGDKLIIPDIDE